MSAVPADVDGMDDSRALPHKPRGSFTALFGIARHYSRKAGIRKVMNAGILLYNTR